MSGYAKTKSWRAAQPNLRELRSEEARKWRAAHPEVAKAIKQRYRESHKDMILDREAKQARARRKKDPEGELRRRKAFEQRKEAKREKIAGRPRQMQCEICFEHGKTVFDHDHNSGNFRGWICDRCNKVLGLAKDSPLLLRRMARYLSDGGTQSNEKKQPAQQRFWTAE